ncbi:hypothetical protein PCE1_000186 [Barthelona sp. PCE]
MHKKNARSRKRTFSNKPNKVHAVENDLRTRAVELLDIRRELPVFDARDNLVNAIREHKAVVIVGHTGSGKSTQLPQFLSECEFISGMISVTQPRRVAAITLAQRVSEEMGVEIGQECGYSIRFENKTSKQTRVRFCTDGMLLREAQDDPLLSKQGVIILDEAHERTIATDILFGIIKNAMVERDDLRVIVMSATLQSDLFSKYFDCPVLFVKGRQHPIAYHMLKSPVPDYVEAAINSVFHIHLHGKPGDILVFLTGQEEIESTAEIITQRSEFLPKDVLKLQVTTLFAAMQSSTQLDVFKPAKRGHRKVILATNIAETSITLTGVRHVVESGVEKIKTFNPATNIHHLMVTPVSKASVFQRCGRAGREAPGDVWMLYTLNSFNALQQSQVPEVLRCSVVSTVLRLKVLGVENIRKFDFLQAPNKSSIKSALRTLMYLNALDRKLCLTDLGRKMAAFPVEPSLALVLLRSHEFHCSEEMLTLVALLSVDNLLVGGKGFDESSRRTLQTPDGDHIMLLNVYRMYKKSPDTHRFCEQYGVSYRSMKQAVRIRVQLKDILCRELGTKKLRSIAPLPGEKNMFGMCVEGSENIRRCLVYGFFSQCAQLNESRKAFQTVLSHQECQLHPTSCLMRHKPDFLIFSELQKSKNRLYMKLSSPVERSWLLEAAPMLFGN